MGYRSYHNTPSVINLLQSLDWRTLKHRRVDSGLCMLYKIRSQLVAIDEDNYMQRGTGRHSHKYHQLRADKDYTRFSFFPRIIMQWNQIPSQTCLAESFKVFKTQFAKIEHSRLNFPNIFYHFFSLPFFSSICLS